MKCQCGADAVLYAMDTCPGGWAGYYCQKCKPCGWQVTDVLEKPEPVERQQFSQYRMSEYTTPGTESGRMTEGSPK